MKKIGVLLGGKSTEREISLKSGAAVANALRNNQYQVVEIDPAADNFIEILKEEHIDAAYLALHGKYGEDGTIQGLLEFLDIAYTGSGVMASAIAINKIMTKKVLAAADIPTAPFITINFHDYSKNGVALLDRQIRKQFGYPVAIKSPNQGSSIGIYFADNDDELNGFVKECFLLDNKDVLIEKMIKGKEITVPVWDYRGKVETMPQIEIIAQMGSYYDFASKYKPGGSRHVIPPDISENMQKEINDYAIKAYNEIGCKGIARVDFIVDSVEQKAYVLEVNTIPGMTSVSLVPDSAAKMGISFDELVNIALKSVL